ASAADAASRVAVAASGANGRPNAGAKRGGAHPTCQSRSAEVAPDRPQIRRGNATNGSQRLVRLGDDCLGCTRWLTGRVRDYLLPKLSRKSFKSSSVDESTLSSSSSAGADCFFCSGFDGAGDLSLTGLPGTEADLAFPGCVARAAIVASRRS